MKLWLAFAALVLAQIGYPLTRGQHRATLVAVTVLLGFAFSVCHAAATRGLRTAAALVGVTAAGGLAVETLGVASGFPFGGYAYSSALGPRLSGVPAVIPLAWTWMAWPAWLAAGAVTRHRVGRTALAGLGLAAWDLFLDPQMVAEGYWQWRHPSPHLPGVPGVPLTNYLGWLVVALLMMALFGALAGPRAATTDPRRDAPALALYVWTYLSSILALAVFLGQPAAAAWVALGMAPVAIPVTRRLFEILAGFGRSGNQNAPRFRGR